MSSRARRFLFFCALLEAAALAASCTGSEGRAHSRNSTPSSTSSSNGSSTAAPTSAPAASSPAPQASGLHGYLAVSRSQIIFLEWNDSGGELQGAYHVLRASSTGQVAPQMRVLAGKRNGNDVSLSISGAPTWSGRFHDDTLTLIVPGPGGATEPVDLTPATSADYERAAREFRQRLAGSAR